MKAHWRRLTAMLAVCLVLALFFRPEEVWGPAVGHVLKLLLGASIGVCFGLGRKDDT